VTVCEDCHNEITFRTPKVMEKLKSPDDITRWTALMDLIGPSNSQAFTMALKVGFAMESLESATTQTGRVTAARVFQQLRSEIDEITKRIFES